MGIQAMKSTANAKLLQAISLKDCLSYVLSLPIHCLALGCTTLGQIEDDVRIARHFKPLAEEQLAQIRADGARLRGPQLEDWKRNSGEKADKVYCKQDTARLTAASRSAALSAISRQTPTRIRDDPVVSYN